MLGRLLFVLRLVPWALMRILHLAWEYPPVMYGGLGRHVHALANAQASNSHEVVVITQAPGGDVPLGDSGLVHVLRTGFDPSSDRDLLSRVEHLESAFTVYGEQLLGTWQPDVIHAHDWMVTRSSIALRRASGAALAATIHATEAGRNHGWISSELSTAIHAQEWWLANTADGVITCSHAMREEVRALFGAQAIRVIPNGVELPDPQAPLAAAARIRADNADASPLVAYTGRIEWEKGVQTLVEAVPRLRRSYPGLRVLVAGRGSYLPSLQQQAAHLDVHGAIRFLGWVSEEDLRGIVAAADVAIVPSLYEPFGLVALEAAALGTPVVVARTGGLAEFAQDGKVAATFTPGDADSLAGALEHDLADPASREERVSRATRALAVDYDWRVIADSTVEAYAWTIAQLGTTAEDPRRRKAEVRRWLAPPHFVAPLGKILDRVP